jgi:hypothetical protein
MGEERKVYRVVEDQGVDGSMGSEWLLGSWLGEFRVDSVGSG